MSNVDIVSSGAKGNNGSHGAGGIYPGGSGRHGDTGAPGTSAKANVISLSFNDGRGVAEINDSASSSTVPLAESSLKASSVKIFAFGGHGGHGGDGGNGASGYPGSPGSSATQYSAAGNGGPGGPGGNGGRGGDAGNGGNGSQVTVRLSPEDADLLMLIEQVDISEGIAGTAGSGGRGGMGGPGGPGGSGCSWTEYQQASRQVSSTINGQTTYRTEYYQQPISKSRPGGFAGPPGISGSSGASGSRGSHGVPGSYEIEVKGVGTFADRYNLIVTAFKHLFSDDGIIEPGETLHLEALSVENNGRMPTPAAQDICVSLQSNGWIKPLSAGENLARSIAINGRYCLPQTLPFEIRYNFKMRPNVISKEIVSLQWDGRVSRVGKAFPSVDIQVKTFEVRYPLELSLIYGPRAITTGEEAPFAIEVRNVSTEAVGVNAKHPRRLVLELQSDSAHARDVSWLSADGGRLEQKMGTPKQWCVDLLPAKSKLVISGTLQFGEDVPFYTRVPLVMSLQLSERNQTQTLKTLQCCDTNLQYSPAYVYDPSAELLLVTNEHTSREEVLRWKETARSLGTSLGEWNVSLYQGFDFHYRRNDGGQFIAQLAHKVVVILNNRYDIHAEYHRCIVEDDLRMAEIYQAARDARIACYMVGEVKAFAHLLKAVPAVVEREAREAERAAREAEREAANPIVEATAAPDEGEAGADKRAAPADVIAFAPPPPPAPLATDVDPLKTTQVVVKSYGCCSKRLFEKDLIKRSDKLRRKLHREAPHQQHVVVYTLDTKELEMGCCGPTMQLGTLDAYPGLRATEALFASTSEADNSAGLPSGTKHTFNVLKLFPFQHKLSLLLRNYTSDNAALTETIVKAILSDLADEQFIWRQHFYTGKYWKNDLAKLLDHLCALETFNYSDLMPVPQGRRILKNLILRYELLVCRMPKILDYLLFFRRGLNLKHVAQRVIAKYLKALAEFKEDEEKVPDLRRALAKEWKGVSKEDVMSRYRNPFSDKAVCFNSGREVSSHFSSTELPSNKKTKKNIVENRYVFAGEGARERRLTSVAGFEGNAEADAQAATLYPAGKITFDSPDNLAATSKFAGMVFSVRDRNARP